MSTSPEVDVFVWTRDWAQTTGHKLWTSEETASTNAIAKDDTNPATRPILDPLSKFSGPSVYLARKQTAGRGRGSHTWATPEGSALLSSWSFAVARVPQPIFSALVGLALFESCIQVWPEIEFNIKAPNDLFIGDKKTAGILIETIDQGYEKRTVVGIGFNADGLPSEVPTATHLAHHLGRDLQRAEWICFLDAWTHELSIAVASGLEERLSSNAAQRLCRALNLHPLLKEPILKVDEFGQLHSASRLIHWHEL
jgi:BirA family biotin operon repressor/biotin-[acetyl-CoA-carboxylase] ligase